MSPDRWERRRERWERRRERRESRPCWNPFGGALLGLMIMGFGLLFLLRNLDIIYVDNIWQYWPVILIVIGASKLLSPRSSRDIFPGLIIGGIGTYFLLSNLGIIYGNVWQYLWPLVLIAFGASMLIRHMDRGGRTLPRGDVNASGSEESLLNIDVVFSGAKRKVNSQEFMGGKVDAVFGGVELDLRDAGTKLEAITIKADAVFGGIEFRVPAAWDVDLRGDGVFGTVENRAQKPQFVAGVPSPRLIIQASAVFGSVIVRN